MKSVLRPISLLTPSLFLGLTVSAADWLQPSLAVKAGYDSNVIAITEGAAGAPKEDSVFVTAGVSLAADVKKSGLLAEGWKSARVTFDADSTRFSEMSEENFVSARLGLAGKWEQGADSATIEASGVRINGSKEGYESAALANAFGVPVWRERRSQWQTRARAQWSHLGETLGWRATARTAVFDMDTIARSGCAAIVDRSDSALALEGGWKQGAGWWWLGGQVGWQDQGTVPLPGGEFEYSNVYRRLSLGWSGKLSSRLKLAFTGGPDWRHYTGRVNSAVFSDRHRSTWWYEADAAYELSPEWQWTARAAQNRVVATTGKSAYDEFAVETGVLWKTTRTVQARAGVKFMQADYFPAVRDDWVSVVTAGVDWQAYPNLKCGVDLAWQYAWSEIQPVPGRDFERTVVSVRGVWSF